MQWFRSFLTSRIQKVRIKGEYLNSHVLLYGVPPGSVLGPKMFSIYARKQPNVFSKCLFKSSSFADDSNGMKTFNIISIQHSDK